MKTYRIAQTDLEVSRLAYGCMQIGGTWNRAEPLTTEQKRGALAAVRAALEAGVTLFDQADIYCAGKSEEAFAEIWKDSPGLRDRIVLQSKCGIRFEGDPNRTDPGRYDFSRDHIVRSVEGSLRRLQTDRLDLLLLHRPDPLVEPEEVARAFDDLHQGGKVRYFGVSNHSAAQIELLRKHVRQPIVVNQVELSLLHSGLIDEGVVFNQTRPERAMRGADTLEYCRLHDITLQAWGPLAHGAVLTGGGKAPGARRTAQLVAQMAREKNVGAEAIALGWLLRHPARLQPIIGSTKPERIRAACQADEVTLTREEWYQLFVAGRGAKMP
jgi:predicted oxidoreductase